ncbi:MAG: hypothetical protein DWQ07_12700 [Chloroflexi bacterium]|nr:MAG: hypothetical protein DWQ07_12700 [Chloroflexota bacterium]MBL1196897.1 hypothetical protein [Chloroflexota bacterium]NOH14193.1 hypothetical protein [Chloroflexota bacterium]
MRETNKAKQAFEDYFGLGPGRSLQNLHQTYTKAAPDSVPTRHLRTLKQWSSEHNWQERVAEREAALTAEAMEELRETATKTGYALFFKRIADLNVLAELLFDEILTEDKRWLPDVKQIGAGEFAERVDIVRFNAGLIGRFLDALEALATEMGERKHGVEVTGRDGGPIEHIDIEAIRKKRWKDVEETLARVLAEEQLSAEAVTDPGNEE